MRRQLHCKAKAEQSFFSTQLNSVFYNEVLIPLFRIISWGPWQRAASVSLLSQPYPYFSGYQVQGKSDPESDAEKFMR